MLKIHQTTESSFNRSIPQMSQHVVKKGKKQTSSNKKMKQFFGDIKKQQLEDNTQQINLKKLLSPDTNTLNNDSLSPVSNPNIQLALN